MSPYGYHRVPGSARLKTQGADDDPAVAALDALDPASPGGREVDGEWLARTVVRSGYVPLLTDVLDRLALEQTALEQAVYAHLYRLALGEERNWCRVSRQELSTRTQLSDRRLGKALAGLAEKGHVRLVHRDRRGTLYRVVLPHEVFGESDKDRVHVASRAVRPAGTNPAPTPPPPKTGPASVPERPAPAPPRKATPQKDHEKDTLQESYTIGGVAAAFLKKHGGGRGRSKAEVVEAILDRLEAGRSLEAIADELEQFAKAVPKKTPIEELPRFLERSGS